MGGNALLFFPMKDSPFSRALCKETREKMDSITVISLA